MEIEEAGATVFPYRLIELKPKKEPAVVTVPDPVPLPTESPIEIVVPFPFIAGDPLVWERLKHVGLTVATVTVLPLVPELVLKKTASSAVGTDAPPGPPDVADQLVVLVPFHVPFPPTQ
jgi:hypothetical protein